MSFCAILLTEGIFCPLICLGSSIQQADPEDKSFDEVAVTVGQKAPFRTGLILSAADVDRYTFSYVEGGKFEMVSSVPNRTTVFISYSHEDAKYFSELSPHLEFLEKNKLINFWADTKINPGEKWRDKIEAALISAKIAILLISIDFLNSQFITNNELPPLLAAAEGEGVKILPVILRPCRLPESLSQFQAINSPSRPLSAMEEYEREELWVKVANATIEAMAPQHIDEDNSSKKEPAPSKVNPFVGIIRAFASKFGSQDGKPYHNETVYRDPKHERPLQATPKDGLMPQTNNVVKNYIYVSDTKVQMLYSQIPRSIRQELDSELNIDSGETLYSKTQAVTKYVEDYFDVGTIETPSTYFKGTLSMTWGPLTTDEKVVYFGGLIGRTVLGLGGSMHHIIGRNLGQPFSTPSMSPLLFLLDALRIAEEDTFRNSPNQAINPRLFAHPIDLVAHLTLSMIDINRPFRPWQQLEFLAKTLLQGPLTSQENLFTGDLSYIVFGSPIYVASAD